MNEAPPDDDAGDDGATPGDDAQGDDALGADGAGDDGTTADTSAADTNAPDTTLADVNGGDTNASDTNASDGNGDALADGAAKDGGKDGGKDAGVDAGRDAGGADGGAKDATAGDASDEGDAPVDAYNYDAHQGDATMPDAAPIDAAMLPDGSVIHCDFSSFADMTLNGSAQQIGNILRLTDTTNNIAGSAFWNHAIAFDPMTSFWTFFSLRMGPHYAGGDGLVFVVQSSSAGTKALGSFGGNLGYAGPTGIGGIAPSIGIEFDTYQNAGDEDANHVALLSNGDVTDELVYADPPFVLASTEDVYAWVEYSAPSKTIAVYVDDNNTKPSQPLFSYVLDLATLLGNDPVYVGFSAGNGAATNNEDLDQWVWSTSGPVVVCPPFDGGPQDAATE